MCEGCACNLPAKVSFCLGTAFVVIGSIVYAIGAAQAGALAAQSMIIDGKRTFTLDVRADGDYAQGYSFFRQDWSDCQEHSDEIAAAFDAVGQSGYVALCGWTRGTYHYGGRDLVSIGHFSPSWTQDASTVSFNVNYWTWVVDASVDLDDVHDAFELVGITMAGFAVTALGSIMCCVACCLMCCIQDSKTTVIQQVPIQQQGPGTAMVVGQPVMGQPVTAQPV